MKDHWKRWIWLKPKSLIKCRFIRGVFLVVDLGSEIIFCAIAWHYCLAILMLQGNNKKNLGKHWGRKKEDLKGKKKEISSLHPNTITLCYIRYCRDLFFAELNASPILDSFYCKNLLFRNFSENFYHFSKLHKKKIYLGIIKRNFNLVPS